MRSWRARHWLWATFWAVAVGAAIGVVTDLIPNPVFVRMIEAPWWSYPVWIASSVLSGLLIVTYMADPNSDQRQSTGRRTSVGTVLSFLAVGCPTCNKLVVIALGTQGAVTWFEPIQPVLAIGSLALLGYALRARLRSLTSCPVPDAPSRP